MRVPDYSGGSIVNLMASLIRARGGDATPYPEADALPGARLSRTRDLVLMVMDGLGDCMLAESPQTPVLRGLQRATLTSVFPSTTASAITTFLTGLAPQQHGVPGWFTHFPELGGVTVTLPFLDRADGSSRQRGDVTVTGLLRHTPVFDRLATAAYSVVPSRIAGSPYNTAHLGRATVKPYKSLTQFFDTLIEVMNESPDPKFIYAYWPKVDHIAHEYGVGSHPLRTHMADLDKAFGRFLDRLRTDATVVVTADHGLIDAKPRQRIVLDAHPKLQAMLALPLCGEQRVAYCYVRPGREHDFESYVRERWSEGIGLYRSAELIEHGYFGTGPVHPGLRRRIGDYTLIMRDGYTIKDWLPGEKRFRHTAVHGALSDEEMLVPLVVAEG